MKKNVVFYSFLVLIFLNVSQLNLFSNSNVFNGYIIPDFLSEAVLHYNNSDYHQTISILKNNYNLLENKEKYLLAVCHKKLRNYDEAIPLFEELSQRTRILRNSSTFHLAEIHFFKRNFIKAEELFKLVLNGNNEPYFIKQSYYYLARINRNKGNPNQAVQYLNKLLPYHTTVYSYVRDVLLNELTYPDILYEIANIYLESNNHSRALQYYLRIVHDYSQSTTAFSSVRKIDSIPNAVLSDEDKYQIARLYYNRRSYNESEEKFLSLLNSYIRRDIDDKRRISQIRYLLGMTYYRKNEYQKALRQFDIISRLYTILDECPPTLYFTAIINRRLNDEESFINNLNRIIQNYPNNRYSLIAFRELLQFYNSKNDFNRIQRTLRHMIRYYSNQRENLIESYWLKITYYYSNGKFSEIRDICYRMKDIITNQNDRLKLNFWLGNAYEKLGDTEKSKKYHHKNLLIDNRENYYFWSSVRKVDQDNSLNREYQKAEISNRDLLNGIYSLIREDYPRTIELIQVLAVIGLYDEVFDLINNHTLTNVGKQSKFLAQLAFLSNNYYYSILHSRRYKNNSGLRNQDFDLWNLLFPLGYENLIQNVVNEHPFDINYVLAIIYQESLFTEKAVSVAGARGLMQIMPATGRQISNRLGRTGYNPDVLFDVETNVLFGINELRTLYNNYIQDYSHFTAQVFTSIGYNAGPHRVTQWLNRFFNNRDVDDNMDYFIEVIPFNETRNYVRHIITRYWLYKEIYDL